MMAINVTVPSSLLEDIFRLLDYLDMEADRDELHFYKNGYSRRFEHDTALWELKLKIKQLRRQSVETYLLTIDNGTDDERHDLWEWVAAGYSVYDNPYSLYDKSGSTMDFINGCRIGLEMSEEYSYFFDFEPDDTDEGSQSDELPF